MSLLQNISVNKIGGVNMSRLDQVAKLVEVRRKRNEKLVLVVSAFKGVTNALIAGMDRLSRTDYTQADVREAFKAAKRLHEDIIEQYFQEKFKDAARGLLEKEFEALVLALTTHKEVSAILDPVTGSFEIRDQVIGFGENMAKKMLAIYLNQKGFETRGIDDVDCNRGDFNGGVISNVALHKATQKAIKEAYGPAADTQQEIVDIFGGHVGNMPRGIAVDVGRSYSDTTAVNVALVMRERVDHVVTRFWKDVDGVMTANPKELGGDPANKPIAHSKVDIREGLEAAASGSLLMQVDALALAEEHGLDLRLQNIANPEADQGTDFVNMRYETGLPFKMIVTNAHIDSITVTIPQMANKPGFGTAITAILDQYDISYDINPTGGTSMTFTVAVPQDESDRKAYRQDRIQRALNEMKKITVRGEIYEMREDPQWVEDARASISIIGNELKNQQGILARLATVLGRHGIDIKAVAQDEKQMRVTFLIDSRQRDVAVRELHREFFGKKKD